MIEPVLIIASVCEPGAGGCHPSGFRRRHHDRREPPVKTSGVCQIGIDCPPGVGAPAKALALGMSPVPRRHAPVAPPSPAQVERVVARAKPVQYVVMSAPAPAPGTGTAPVAQPARRIPASTVSAPQARTVTLPRVGGGTATSGTRSMTSRQVGIALRAAKILRVH